MELPDTISLPTLEALIREKYRGELPSNTYWRYINSRWPQVMRFIGSRPELAEAFCADVRNMPTTNETA